MQPNSSNNQTSPSNDFFFLNTPPSNQKPLMSFNKLNFRGKLIMILAAFIVIVLIIIVINALTTNKSVNLPTLYNVINVDNNIQAIAQNGAQNATAANLTDLAYNAIGTSNTNIYDLENLLTKNNIQLSSALITTDNNLTNQLNNANSLGYYNSKFTSLMNSELTEYQAALSTAYKANSSPAIRQYLSNDYSNAKLLLVMLKSNYS